MDSSSQRVLRVRRRLSHVVGVVVVEEAVVMVVVVVVVVDVEVDGVVEAPHGLA